MDDFDFLDKEQEDAIRQFFQNFSIEKHTKLEREIYFSLGQAWGHLSELSFTTCLFRHCLRRNALPQCH